MAKIRPVKSLRFDIDDIKEIGKVSYRPMITSEHKILLTAIELKSPDAILNAVLDITQACVGNSIAVKNLPMYVVDSLFLRIYSKSVGDKSQVLYTCGNTNAEGDKCGNEVNLLLDLSRSRLDYPEAYEDKRLIQLDDSMFVKMRAPTFEQFRSLDTSKEWYDVSSQLIYSSIECISQDGELIVPGAEFSFEEFSEWIESQDGEVIRQMNQFFKDLPELILEVDVKCPVCGGEDHFVIRGLDDFFA